MKVSMALAFPLRMARDAQDVACDSQVASQVASVHICHLKQQQQLSFTAWILVNVSLHLNAGVVR
jgi:hypothetical protein